MATFSRQLTNQTHILVSLLRWVEARSRCDIFDFFDKQTKAQGIAPLNAMQRKGCMYEGEDGGKIVASVNAYFEPPIREIIPQLDRMTKQ